MKKIRMRLGFDIALGLLLIFEMLYTLTGNVLHEAVGIVFFATMAAHLVFARKWSGSMVRSLKERRKLPDEQKARLVIAIALALCAVALAVSSVAISNLLGPSPEYLLSGAYTAWCLVHTVSAYGMCVLAVVHLLLHWVFVAKVLKISYNPERRQAINTAMGAVAGVAAVAIGAAGLQAVASFAGVPLAGQLDDGASGGRNGSGRKGSGANGGEGPDADGDLPADGSNGNNAPDSNEGEAAPSSPEGSEEAAPSQRNQRGQRRRGTEEGGDPSSSGEGSSSNGRNGSNAPDDGSASGSDGSNDRQPNSGNGSGSNGSNGTAPDSGNGSGSNGGNGSSTSDICTLCRKYCPLSAPRCNKPYAAGLI